MPVPNIFGTATSAIPLSQLDTNFATPVTIGNTAVQLGNTVTSFGNVTLTNVTISSGNVTVSAGSNTAPSITTVGDTNTGIFFPAADTIAFAEGGVESMRIDSVGKVGVGITPSAWLSTSKAMQVGYLSLVDRNLSEAYVGHNFFYNSSNSATYSSNGYASRMGLYNGTIFFDVAASGTAGNAVSFTQAMTLDASGNLLVGTTAQIQSGKQTISYNASTHNGLVLSDSNNTTSGRFISFNLAGTAIGSVERVGATSAVVYNTTSDQRLKSNIVDANPVLDKLMTVKVRQYDWTDGDLHQDYGFIAQELEPVLSGVVTKGKTDDDMWQLDYSRLTPHLLKAIQEQQAIIQTLTDRITALEQA
jgi:hypothetical protein